MVLLVRYGSCETFTQRIFRAVSRKNCFRQKTKSVSPKELDKLLKDTKHDIVRYDSVTASAFNVVSPNGNLPVIPIATLCSVLSSSAFGRKSRAIDGKPGSRDSAELFARKVRDRRDFDMNCQGVERFEIEAADVRQSDWCSLCRGSRHLDQFS